MKTKELRKQFEQETGKGCEIPDFEGEPRVFTEHYVRWLENKILKQELDKEQLRRELEKFLQWADIENMIDEYLNR
jgi:hypothetical protein